MILFMVVALLFGLAPPDSVAGLPAGAAVDRGLLSLAWDAHESGLMEEALGYLEGIDSGSPVGADALWLRADCLYQLERYPEAARVLQSEAGRTLLADRDSFLLDVYWDWAWSATRREAYGAVAEILDKGLRALPGDRSLKALALATRFRAAVAGATAGGGGRLPTGEEVAVRALGVPPAGQGWVQAYPWKPDLPWVPRATVEEWMPNLASRLRTGGRALWVKLSAGALRRRLAEAARADGLVPTERSGGTLLSYRGETAEVALAEWLFRAAAEGLGVEGAASYAAAEVREDLERQASLTSWVEAHRGRIELSRVGGLLLLRDPDSGRSLDLDPAAWSDAFAPAGQEWTEFWSDVTAELRRPQEPFRCFCGREVILREVLVRDPSGATVFEKGPGYSLVVAALCPLHQQYVTDHLLRQWGLKPEQVWERARADALKSPWNLVFRRGEAQGAPYVVLEGEGVAALARRPPLLLGALEAVDGVMARGTSVRLIAPSASSLVIAAEGTPESVAEEASARVLLGEEQQGGLIERLGYRTTVRLPSAGAVGTFNLSPGD